MDKTFIIDEDRKQRLGFDEVIFGASKSVALLTDILKAYSNKNENVLITKLQEEKAVALLEIYKNAFYDTESGIFTLQAIETLDSDTAKVGIISAGSSDIGVANEAYYTLNYMGVPSRIVHDVGVAGLHRLLNKLDDLKTFDVLIVVAGFEGALPTVVGGLLPQPIIGVPTSVGYGSAKEGETALHAMLTSCANGITVVNIDNGYGAAMSAFRMIKLLNK
ncbi:nickel pincer cofactor biosynthesis protein LarB [Cellulophaga baltica]|uniref:nickel pincer cofactor biosynthesis protein LarB n=1 Tax=Cellulophaga TaxID=104264 RepID=UPI001C068B89|nr:MULTISPECIES: nickel pincer cofactor biosynthesis protein LarB [Cellulophaga]MBU2996795.1 nickel pincer cofactor biosynthesis protein LarB [Cellulophaga baltica]MDO6768191.1 nickel pincer cofactor biosynthesis protein LarB [Cellulophaga sp. 1_MG-2023]